MIMKYNIIYKGIAVLAACLCLALNASCVEEFNANVGDSESNALVIEGTICSDSTVTFHLSRSYGLDENVNSSNVDFKVAVDNATLEVKGTDGTTYPGTSVGDGAYEVKVGTLNKNTQYYVNIKYDNAEFTSEPMAPLDAPEIEYVSFAQDRDDRQVDILVTSGDTKDSQYLRWTYDEVWEVNSYYRPAYDFDPDSNAVVKATIDHTRGWFYENGSTIQIGNTAKYSTNKIDKKRLFAIENNDNRVSVCYCLNIKQYAISQAQYEYEDARNDLGEEMGGMFAPMPSELPSNITCSDKSHRAIGFVGVCGKVATCRFFLYRNQIEYQNDMIGEFLDDPTKLAWSDNKKYTYGYRVTNEVVAPGVEIKWAYKTFTDVRELGATLVRPSYWPI